MLSDWVIVGASFAYLGLLFAVAYYGDKRADQGHSIIANPYIYSLSLGVYATAWTFYGSVGRVASNGIGFLPIYLGPTLMCALWWFVLRKIIRICKTHRITSLADFIGSRYGKSALLAGLVTVIALVGIVPYISLQLKAVSGTIAMLLYYPDIVIPQKLTAVPVLRDPSLYIALLLAAFTIIFGTRHLDASERHEGMVAAIACESVVKLVAFLALGVFVTYWMYDGLADVFGAAAKRPELAALFVIGGGSTDIYRAGASFASLTFLSMLAIMFLPRQFQVAVVENVDEKHVAKAMWLFPAYMLAINLFVLPIAFAGLLHFPRGSVDPDTFVLALPMAHHQQWLALLAFLGGLSGATGMVIVETIALATMVCNDLLMPVLLRVRVLRLAERRDLTGVLLSIRRGAIVLVLLLGYAYFRLAGEAYALVSIGLISFAAVAQFGPALLGGIFWKGGTRAGALAGLIAGFALWLYTLLLPAFAKSGWLPIGLLEQGPLGIALLKPEALFGLAGLDQITHALLWSMLANFGFYVGVSLVGRPGAAETSQATLFVDVMKGTRERLHFWRGTAHIADLHALLARFLGQERADGAFTAFANARGLAWPSAKLEADADLVHGVETQLAGAIGASSARIMVASAVKEEALTIEEVLGILDEASQIIVYSHRLEQKSRALEKATAELRAANERLKEVDKLKDDFVSGVSHELRTPLTSVLSFAEILRDTPDVSEEERAEFLGIIIKESERLIRLINQILDLSKIEAGRTEWRIADLNLVDVVRDSVTATSQLFRDRQVRLALDLPESGPLVRADRDRLMQVLINLLSNAVKFCARDDGRVEVRVRASAGEVRVDVKDNGEGLHPEEQEIIFEKFRQAGDTLTDKPQGTGLGLPISRQIIEHFKGRLWVESAPSAGAMFSFTLPVEHRTETARHAPLDAVAGRA
jgi:Na+/proline symporter/nitrogen-specific signal transduction histidine kinase